MSRNVEETKIRMTRSLVKATAALLDGGVFGWRGTDGEEGTTVAGAVGSDS